MPQFVLSNGWTIIGMLSYVLLIASMGMRQMLPLRLFAIASGVFGALYCWFYLGDWVTSSWESIFVLVNLVQVGILANEHYGNTDTPDEERLRQTLFADLDNHEFTALMRIAQWHEMAVGDKLTEEGQPVSGLMLLTAGSVHVALNGRPLAVCRDNDFIGELSFLSNAPASATTAALSAGRYLSFNTEQLRTLVSREPGLERLMQRLLNVNLVEKLRATSLHQT